MIGESLQQGNEERIWCLAALSLFGEAVFSAYAASGADSFFWKLAERVCGLSGVKKALNESVSKAVGVLRRHGIAFKGNPLTTTNVNALRSLQHFVVDGACRSAFALAEVYSPELRDPTLLSRIATACAHRGVSDDKAKEYFAYVLDSLRAARLTGDIDKDEKLSLSKVVGRDRKQPAMIHALFRKKEFIDFFYHEVSLMDNELSGPLAMFASPLKIMQKFATSGADGLVASYRKPDSAAPAGMEALFAVSVAQFREGLDPKRQAMLDVVWPLWSGGFDAAVEELVEQDVQQPNKLGGFLWHLYLDGANHEWGVKYRACKAACKGGPIAPRPDEHEKDGEEEKEELGEKEKGELHRLQEQLKKLRRKSVQFVSLPKVGAAIGPEFAVPQLQTVWESINYGHRFKRKRGDVRALVVSAELFPPNLAKQGAKARLSEPMAADEAKLKKVLDFLASKRDKDDVLIMFDGRGKANRRLIDASEGSSESHSLVECWCVYVQPTKKQDPRAPARAGSYTCNNKEIMFLSLPINKGGGRQKVVQRSQFNVCGETSSSATTYTGIAMRRFSELPRMSHDTKASILGAPACGSLDTRRLGRLQADIDAKGHPFSHAEVKPITLWQDIVQHLGVTHIVDLTPGSGALAVAASGAAQYEGIAANDAHRDWLDNIVDRCVMYKAGHEQGYAKDTLGGDPEFVANASRYFGSTMMDARRWLMPDAGGDGEEDGGDDDEVDVDDDDEE